MVKNNECDDLNDDIPIPEASYADLYELGFWNYKKAKLTIIWGREVNKNKQILLLRKLCPQLNEISLSRIYQIVQEKGYKGIPIINWKDIPPSTYLIILIPGYDIEKVQNMIENVELQKKIIPIDQLVKAALLQE